MSDNCDTDPILTFENSGSLDECGEGTLTRTWTATDCAGNTSTCAQSITIEDTVAPTITCAADITIECDVEVVWGDPTVSDNCDTDPVLTFENSGSLDECGRWEQRRVGKATRSRGST